MLLSDLFTAGDLVVPFDPADKWSGIQALVQHVCDSGRLPAELFDDVLDAVISRERSMSTGMEHGVAIPHAAVEGLESVAVAMGLVQAEEGLPFESVDGRPARIVVLLIIPRAQKLLHIRTLADVARALSRDELRDELLSAEGAQAAFETLLRHEG